MTKDILIGSAHVPAHADGGWALPGGGRTTDESVARSFASSLSKLIGQTAPVTSMNPPIPYSQKMPRNRTQSLQDRFSCSPATQQSS